MKKILSLLLCFCVLFSTACSIIDAPLRNAMTKFYSDDSNYQETSGIVKEIRSSGFLRIQITEKDTEYWSRTEDGLFDFTLFTNVWLLEHISEGDEIVFTSAPFYHYNGHVYPIVALEKNEQVLLRFEEGKADYLAWIQETFG